MFGFVGLYQLHLTADDSYTCFKKKLAFCGKTFVYLLLRIICVNKILNALKKRSYSTLVFKVIAAIFLSFTRNKRLSS